MVEFFNQGWVGSVIGIIGVILGILGLLAYRVSRIGPRPTYQMQSRRLLGKEEQELPPEVEILFNKVSVPRLTISRVIFWNSGNSTITGNQIVESDPIQLDFENGTILKAHVLKSTRDAIKFNVGYEADAHKVALSFDFLDPDDGAVVEVVHTSDKRNPQIHGTIRGVPNGIVSWGEILSIQNNLAVSKHARRRKLLLKVATIFMAIIGLVAIVFALLPENIAKIIHELIKSEEKPWSFHVGKRIAIFAFGVLYSIPPILLFWIRRPRFPKSLQGEE